MNCPTCGAVVKTIFDHVDINCEMVTGPVYLGDAVYASFDGFNVWLKTSDGIADTNAVALEPAVLEAFLKYIERVQEFRKRCLEG